MSREISTLLTGRHLSFEIFPLSFSEFLHFNQITPPEHKRPVDASPVIKQALNNYIKWGGFPAVTLAKTDLANKQINFLSKNCKYISIIRRSKTNIPECRSISCDKNNA